MPAGRTMPSDTVSHQESRMSTQAGFPRQFPAPYKRFSRETRDKVRALLTEKMGRKPTKREMDEALNGFASMGRLLNEAV